MYKIEYSIGAYVCVYVALSIKHQSNGRKVSKGEKKRLEMKTLPILAFSLS